MLVESISLKTCIACGGNGSYIIFPPGVQPGTKICEGCDGRGWNYYGQLNTRIGDLNVAIDRHIETHSKDPNELISDIVKEDYTKRIKL